MRLTLLMTLVTGLAAGMAQAGEQTTWFEVGDLTCASCSAIAMNVMRGVDSTEVLDAEMTNETVGMFTLRFDDTLTSAEDIALAVVDGAGYRAAPLYE